MNEKIIELLEEISAKLDSMDTSLTDVVRAVEDVAMNTNHIDNLEKKVNKIARKINE